jgi:hypothetical protein
MPSRSVLPTSFLDEKPQVARLNGHRDHNRPQFSGGRHFRRWHAELLRLRDRKRVAIHKWRHERAMEKAAKDATESVRLQADREAEVRAAARLQLRVELSWRIARQLSDP